jgi:hypothetical protein
VVSSGTENIRRVLRLGICGEFLGWEYVVSSGTGNMW